MVSSQNALLYSYAMYLIGRSDFTVDRIVLRDVIARWFFMTSLTGRYTSSPESAMESDLARLRDLQSGAEFVAMLDRVCDESLTRDFWEINLPNDLATSAARSPSLYAYFAALNLLDSRVLFSQMKVSELLDPALQPKKQPLERHHLFPRAYLGRLGITDIAKVNQIANYALVEWPDNIEISDRPPSEYFPQMADGLTPAELGDMRFWHALPEGWQDLHYDEFLTQRRQAIAKVIRVGYDRLRAAQS